MGLEEGLIIGALGFSTLLFYVGFKINPGDDNDETGEKFDPLLQGLRIFLLLMGFVSLLVIPPLMWHLTDLNAVGCTSACTQYNNIKTIINLDLRGTQFVFGMILLFVITLLLYRLYLYLKSAIIKSNERGKNRRWGSTKGQN